jgi:POT family proton-dependent oligopeptide transporter
VAGTASTETAFGTQMVALWFLSTAIGTSLARGARGHYTEDEQAPYFGVLGGTADLLAWSWQPPPRPSGA